MTTLPVRVQGFLSLLVILLSAGVVGATEVYVATNGSDANPGTKARPFASLARARDELRTRRTRKAEPATVWIRGGDYVITSSLELSQADSGTAAAPVKWRAMEGEKVRFLGGVVVTNFQHVTDPDVMKRLGERARGKVWVADLRAAGITELAAMKSRGFGRPTTAAHNELFFEGKPMTLARWPNEPEWQNIAGFPEKNAQPDGHGGRIGSLEEGFIYSGDRPKGWVNPQTAWVHGYWAWDWANSYERVTALDADQRLIRTAAPFGLYGFRKGQRFYFLNVLEELDSPGEYYIDPEKGLLYFWPPEGKSLGAGTRNEAEALVSRLGEPFAKLIEASHITLEGIILEGSRGTAVNIRGGASNEVAGCLIRNTGNYGVVIEGGRGSGVRSCDIVDTGDGGVNLSGGDRKTLTGGGNYVENCRFERQGRWSKCYVPAILIDGVGQRASHNLISDHPHCAILYSGNDHLIEFNEIHHIALETGDVGAIYSGRDYTYRGNQIRHNFIHETGGIGMGSMGIYMDDCVSGTEIFGNVFYKVQRAVFLGGGRDHIVRNNIFVDCNYAVELDGRGLDKSPVWHGMVDDTMRQRLRDIPLQLYRARYPAMKSLDASYGPPEGPPIEGTAFTGVPPAGNVVERNVCAGKWLNVYWNARTSPEMIRIDANLTNATPYFVRAPGAEPHARDFELKKDLPLWNGGFQKLPLEQIGLLEDPLRRNLPKQ